MSTTHPFRRALRRTAVGVALAGAVVAGAVAVNRASDDDEPVAAADPLTVATARRTDLSADATLDGVVESSSSITVLHRIEGATPSTAGASTGSQQSTGTTPSGGSGQGGGTGQGMAFAQPVSLVVATPTTPDVSAEAVEDPTTTTTVADTTTPDDSTTSSTTSSTPETTVPVETSTSAPATTSPTTTSPPVSLPAECPTTTTSTTVPTSSTLPDPSSTTTSTTTPPAACTPTTGEPAPTDTAPAAPSMPSGGRGGAMPSGGAGGTGSSATGATGSGSGTTSITERVTSLPSVGETIALGDILYTVDGRPVVALSGSLPAWRSLSTSSDDGPDIAQLELSLAALGYDADGSLVVDNEFDSATAEAVEAWQKGLGLEATGEVELGDVVFLPSTVTVTALDTTVGADVTEIDQIVQVSGAAQQVVATVTDDAVGTVVPGLEVQIDADAGAVTGIVTLMRSVAADDGTITTEAVITPTTEMAGQAGGSSVDVTVAIDGPTDAITVPAEAIVSRLDGTYAVEVRDDTGDHWVAVEILDVRGSNVAVSGIDDGTQVLVPA